MSRNRLYSASSLRPFGTRSAAALAVGMLASSIACVPGDGNGDGDGGTVTEWLGATPHFRAIGHLNGEDLDLTLEGDDANDTALFCERAYLVPQDAAGEPDYANGKLVEVKLHAFLNVGGEEREAEIEFLKHDMSADSAGAKLTVVPRNDASEPASNELHLEWGWKSADGDDIYEQAAQTGAVTVGEFTGTPDDTGLLIPENEGTVGVFATGRWSEDESVALSFTAPCGANTVEIVQ